MSSVPDFAILQNSRTKYTSIWVKEKGEWTDAQPEEYEILAMLAKTLRVTDDPSSVVKMMADEARRIDDETNSE